MEDIGLGAFSVFFTQCPSFLAHQKTMQQAKGQSNAQSLFHLEQIPSDNHIRQTLDPVPPEKLFPCYDAVFESLRQAGSPGELAHPPGPTAHRAGRHLVLLVAKNPLPQLFLPGT